MFVYVHTYAWMSTCIPHALRTRILEVFAIPDGATKNERLQSHIRIRFEGPHACDVIPLTQFRAYELND